MFESVSVEMISYLAESAKVKVWVDENELHYSRSVMLHPKHDTKDSISRMPAEEFINRIEALRILGWKKKYSPDDIWMDGVTWTVKYDDSEHKTYKFEGDNEYPECWNKFMDLIIEVTGEFWVQ